MFWLSLPIAGVGIFAALLGLFLQKPRGEWRAMVGIIGGLNILQAVFLGIFATGATVVAVSILVGLACLVLATSSRRPNFGDSRTPSFRVTGSVGKLS